MKHSFCLCALQSDFFGEKNHLFYPQDSALFSNVQWTGLSTGALPPSFTGKIKGKSLPGKPRWICGQGAACGSCSWCQIPRYEMIRWCDCWLLLQPVLWQWLCCSVLSLPCQGTPRLLLALQAEPPPHPDSTTTCFKWTHLKTCWNKSKSHDFC